MVLASPAMCVLLFLAHSERNSRRHWMIMSHRALRWQESVRCERLKKGRSAVLNELDGIAVRVRHPGGAEAARKSCGGLSEGEPAAVRRA